jgi:transcriptional activator protein UGA3
MAMESTPLMDAMVASSTSHLALCRPDLNMKALEHRSVALTSFLSSFRSSKLSHEFSLAACLTLCSMESFLGDTSAWHDHLSGAASIIRPTLITGADNRISSTLEKTSEGRWMLRNFAYHDILASVSLDSDLLIAGRYWMTDDDDTLDTYFGLASLPVAMVAEVTALRTELRRLEQSPHRDEDLTSNSGSSKSPDATFQLQELVARAEQIEAQLLTWEPFGNHDHALICLAQSYCSAALIYMYRLLRHYRLRNVEDLAHNISKQVILAIQHVEAMPIACLPECTLLFPLFLAGGEITDAIMMQKIRNRMNEIVAHRRFENVKIGLDVLEEVWDVKSRTHPADPSRPYDWLDVLHRRGWKLALS